MESPSLCVRCSEACLTDYNPEGLFLSNSLTDPSRPEAQSSVSPLVPSRPRTAGGPSPQPGPSLSRVPPRRGHGGVVPLIIELMAVPSAAPSRLALALAALAALAAVKYYRDTEAARQQVTGRRGGPVWKWRLRDGAEGGGESGRAVRLHWAAPQLWGNWGEAGIGSGGQRGGCIGAREP